MKRKKVPMVGFGTFSVPPEIRRGIREIAYSNGLDVSEIAREALEMRIEMEKITKRKRR